MVLAAEVPALSSLLFGESAREIELGSVGQEKFCELIAAGWPPEPAYCKAYNVARDAASTGPAVMRMMRNPHIVARIMQLRTAAIKGFSVEREMLLENLLWAVNTARERGNTDQVRKIIVDIGKLFGLIIDKVEASVMGQFTVMQDVTLNGSELAFDIGSGKAVHIRGERIEDSTAKPQAHLASVRALENPSESIKTLDKGGRTIYQGDLQNTFKTLPIEPVALDATTLPIEATLDIGGDARNPLDIVSGQKIAKRATHTGTRNPRPVRRRVDLPGDDAEGEVSESIREMLGE